MEGEVRADQRIVRPACPPEAVGVVKTVSGGHAADVGVELIGDARIGAGMEVAAIAHRQGPVFDSNAVE